MICESCYLILLYEKIFFLIMESSNRITCKWLFFSDETALCVQLLNVVLARKELFVMVYNKEVSIYFIYSNLSPNCNRILHYYTFNLKYNTLDALVIYTCNSTKLLLFKLKYRWNCWVARKNSKQFLRESLKYKWGYVI